MNPFRHLALAAYYHGSRPWRAVQDARRTRSATQPVSILFYHRIADDHPNAWTMPRKAFARQIDWIVRRFDVVTLPEAQRRIASGVNDRPTVCITFDDGYADNCEFALPLLLRQGLPFTYFVTTQNVLEGLPFPHDTAEGIALQPNSIAELRAMADSGVEIAAHTRTHPDIGKIRDSEILHDEIVGSKHDLEEALGRSIRYFAFPYGLHRNMTPEAFRVAYAAGYAGVCSAYGAYNLPGNDAFHLQRCHADPEMLRLKNWLSIDPRKLQAMPYDPGDFRQPPMSLESTTAASGGRNE